MRRVRRGRRLLDGKPLTAAQATMERVRSQRDLARRKLRLVKARYRLARRLFCDDAGMMTADAIAFFNLIGTAAGMAVRAPAPSDREEIWRAAQRAMVLSIMEMVDVDEQYLARLTANARGGEFDD